MKFNFFIGNDIEMHFPKKELTFSSDGKWIDDTKVSTMTTNLFAFVVKKLGLLDLIRCTQFESSNFPIDPVWCLAKQKSSLQKQPSKQKLSRSRRDLHTKRRVLRGAIGVQNVDYDTSAWGKLNRISSANWNGIASELWNKVTILFPFKNALSV